MATVLERFNHLGLARSQKVLSQIGKHIARHYTNWELKRKYQFENDEWICVNDYPDAFTRMIDMEILNLIKAFRK